MDDPYFPLEFQTHSSDSSATDMLLTRVQTLTWPAKVYLHIRKSTRLRLFGPNKMTIEFFFLLNLGVLREWKRKLIKNKFITKSFSFIKSINKM